MKTKNAMQLKAFIKQKAAQNNISAQLVMQNYMLERLLERISRTQYKQHLILKGGFLISAIVGLDSRATMDLDTTIRGMELSHEKAKEIFRDICHVPIDDDVTFEVTKIEDIREADDYPGIRVGLQANYPPLAVPLSVDITTGDKITPCEVSYTFKLLFDERTIDILAYNIETILAEKIETILSRSIANTRPRDFYDIYILYTLRKDEIDRMVLKEAIEQTAKKRGSLQALASYKTIVSTILENKTMQGFWKRYQKDFSYATELPFERVCDGIMEILSVLYDEIE